VGAGLIVSGLSAYGFLAVSARALGPSHYAGISTLWALVFIAVPGVFLPIEQEVGRAVTSRRAHGIGGRPVLVTAARLGAAASAVIAVGALAAAPLLVPHIFDGDAVLLIAFVIGAPAYCLYYLTRGALAGAGRFGRYGALLNAEGVARFSFAAVLGVAGVRIVGAFGMLVTLPCLVGVAAGVRRRGGGDETAIAPGPAARMAELSTRMGFLLAGSLLAQSLLNAGPLAVKVLAGANGGAVAGTFLNGLVISRIPLFFFQAVQAALLPALSIHAALKRHDLFRSDLRRLLLIVVGLALLAVVANWAIGPFVVEHVFGGAYHIGHGDMAALAAASGSFMVALALAQGLIALQHHRDTVLAWLIGVVVFAGVTLVHGAPLLRVERGFLAGSLTALVTMQALLTTVSRRVWSEDAA
jgi:O-antigen/teichoic acid export membrane protein